MKKTFDCYGYLIWLCKYPSHIWLKDRIWWTGKSVSVCVRTHARLHLFCTINRVVLQHVCSSTVTPTSITMTKGPNRIRRTAMLCQQTLTFKVSYCKINTEICAVKA